MKAKHLIMCAGSAVFVVSLSLPAKGQVLVDGASAAAERQPAVPPAPRQSLLMDFKSRVEAVIESRDFAGIQALYQTNGVAAGELKPELKLWGRLFAEKAGPQLFLWLKELSTLPPTARVVWTDQARRLTTHDVTHLVLFRYGAISSQLPLVAVDGRLLIVPSNKVQADPGTELNGATNGSGATGLETNRTPSAAGTSR